jgi:hypothetical protein
LILHTTYVLRVQYSCGVVLVFWFWREIVCGVTYVHSVQYSCAVVSVFWLWREIVLKMRTRFYKNSFCYCVSLSCFVWIYNHAVMIVSQKYRELSMQVENCE